MTTALPPVIAPFIQAQNDHDSTALATCFTDDAVVYDDGRAIRGTAGIKKWSDQNNQDYQIAVEIIDVTQSENDIVLTTSVSGTFDGSPLQFHDRFTISGDKIVALSISE